MTRRPVIGNAGGEMAFEVGNYRSLRVNAAVNVPLGDAVAARVAAQVIQRDGYLSRGYDDEVGQAIRGQLLFQPNDRVSLLVSGDYFNAGGKGPGSVIVPPARVPLAPALEDRISGADPISVAALRAAFPAQFNAGVVIPPQTDGYSRGEFWGVSATAEVDLGFARLTVLPAFRRAGSSLLNYRLGSPVDSSEQSDQVAVETRLPSQGGGPLTYVAGLFFYDQRQDARILNIVGSAQQTNILFDIATRSYAAFGQATYAIVDGVRLVGGVRYTTETKRQNLLSRNPTPTNPNPPFKPIAGRVEFDKVTWKAGVEVDPRPGSLLYANVATGFKSGGGCRRRAWAAMLPKRRPLIRWDRRTGFSTTGCRSISRRSTGDIATSSRMC